MKNKEIKKKKMFLDDPWIGFINPWACNGEGGRFMSRL